MRIRFFKPSLGYEEASEVLKIVMESDFLTAGPKNEEFSRDFSQLFVKRDERDKCGGGEGASIAPFVVPVSSWTAGAYLVLKALGIGVGDEVIVPTLSFVATSAVVIHTGAKPVFVDSDPQSGLIDIDDVIRKITPRTKAVIPVHLWGQMSDMRAIKEIADKYHIYILEDSAHCIEGERDGVKPSHLSDCAIFSFYATKNITCGEGGAVVTFRKDLYDKVNIMKNHGIDKPAFMRKDTFQWWDVIELGFKANITEFQAALLIAQLKKIHQMWRMRKEIFERYLREFGEIKDISFPKVFPHVKHAYHMFCMFVPEREDFIRFMQDRGVGVGVHYRPTHLTSFFRKMGYKEGDFPNAERIGRTVVSLPLYPSLTDDEVSYVIQCVKEFFL